jgi:hypothetical protein
MSFLALTASAVLAPWSGGRVHPYVLAGGGVDHVRDEDRADRPGLDVRSGDATAAFGVAYGGGVEARLGRFAPFVEVRHHVVLLSAESSSLIPVSAGLRS